MNMVNMNLSGLPQTQGMSLFVKPKFIILRLEYPYMDMREAALEHCESLSDWDIINTIFCGLAKRQKALDAAITNILESYDTPDLTETDILIRESSRLAKKIIASLDALNCYEKGILVYWPIESKVTGGVVLRYEDPRQTVGDY